MKRKNIIKLMDVYPTYIINKATRSLPKDSSYEKVEATCKRLYEESDYAGVPLIDEIGNAVNRGRTG